MNVKEVTVISACFALLLTGSSATFAAGGGSVLSDVGALEGKHFHPKGKLPSRYTIDLQTQQRKGHKGSSVFYNVKSDK